MGPRYHPLPLQADNTGDLRQPASVHEPRNSAWQPHHPAPGTVRGVRVTYRASEPDKVCQATSVASCSESSWNGRSGATTTRSRSWWPHVQVIRRRRRSSADEDKWIRARGTSYLVSAAAGRPNQVARCSENSSSTRGAGTMMHSRRSPRWRSMASTRWPTGSCGTSTGPTMPSRSASSAPGRSCRSCATPTASMPGCGACS